MPIYTLAEAQLDQVHRFPSVCIVGAGIAGLLIAVRLARAGQRVIVVESGVESFEERIQELNKIDDPSGYYKRALSGRNREFGGNSKYWGGRLIPMSRHDTSDRPYITSSSWPIPLHELTAYQNEVEQIFGLDDSTYEEELLEQLDPARLFVRRDPDVTCRWAKIPTFSRANLGAALKHEILTHDNVEVWLGATVCNFEVDRTSGRLSSVVAKNFKNHELKVSAREFIFAAGAIESTRLLLLLDAYSDNRPFQGCDALGRYFQEHSKATAGHLVPIDPVKTNRLFGYRFSGLIRRGLYFELTPEAQEADEITSAYAEVALDLPPKSPLEVARRLLRDVQKGHLAIRASDVYKVATNTRYLARSAYWRLMHHQMLIPAGTGLKFEITVEQAPNWNNRISLSPQLDQLGTPMAKLDWRLSILDEHTFWSSIKRFSAYWNRTGFNSICPIAWLDTVGDRSVGFIDIADQRAHPSGSTRMGTDPTKSVVGPNLCCHHIPNLRLVSTSVFPVAGSINPTLTLMQLALRAADNLLLCT
jgi:choline dehydrogenase-like flavoprotein